MTVHDLENRYLNHTPGIMGVTSRFAVLVPLVEWEGETCVLFEVRADTLNRQPGEVCFPGGRIEPGEGPTECAFRETWEELGIHASSIRPIARLDEVFLPSSGMMYPILAQVDAGAVVHMAASTAEVKETFLVPVEFFRREDPLVYTYPMEPKVGEDFPYELIGFPNGYPWRGGSREVPIWTYRGHVIWGLTARILLWNLRERGEGNFPGGASSIGR